ncbi:MAG: DUF1974 domain-containing protein, partial [Verrucomicrobiota bacterium]|nr:DUF1974 domain-containing protein [Verrucomicrobiota bacterium]
VPIERLLRDSRINRIFEGSSEIMRLFIAREALDPHLKIGAPMLNTQLPARERLNSALNATAFYGRWYPARWLGQTGASNGGFHPRLQSHIRWAGSTSNRLARALFHAMARFGPKLETQQVLLGRFVDIGVELFAISATCSRAQSMGENESALRLADYFCRISRERIEQLFHGIHHNADRSGYAVAREVLAGSIDWLGDGIVSG